jgi:hypothetical protein
MSMNKCGHEFVGAADGAACPTCSEQVHTAWKSGVITFAKAGTAVDAGDFVAIRPDGCVVPVVSPKAAGPRRVQVGDVWDVRPDVCGYERGPKRVVRIGSGWADCGQSGGFPLRSDGTAYPEVWILVRAAEEKARPKAAVGQRWRWGGPEAFHVARVTHYDADLYEGPRHACSVTLVDGTLPEPWEFVGEGEAVPDDAAAIERDKERYPRNYAVRQPSAEPNPYAAVDGDDGGDWKPPDQRVIDFLSAPASFSGLPFPVPRPLTLTDYGCTLRELGVAPPVVMLTSSGRVRMYVDAAAKGLVEAALRPVVPVSIELVVETWQGVRERLRRTAEAFAFLAAPGFEVHLRRVAVDNAIAACPPDLDPKGWRAAVLACVEDDKSVGVDLDGDDPGAWIPPPDFAGWVRAELALEDSNARAAYLRAAMPSPRVRRRGEAL